MRHLYLFLLCFAVHITLDAQTFYRVTHNTGTLSIASIPVTVTPINNPYYGGAGGCTDSGPYFIGATGLALPNNSGYRFSFGQPVGKIKMIFEAIDSAETVTAYINGNSYDFSLAAIATYTCSTNVNIVVPTVIAGNLTTNISTTADAYGVVTINPGFPIDSIRIMKGGLAVAGVLHNFYFAKDTFAIINQPFVDTLHCAGDSLYVSFKATNKFSGSGTNVFSVQLSNASGSFASPIVIGTLTSDTSGIIPCKIPVATTYGTGYRIRIVSSAPVKTSQDDGKNIVIGNVIPSGLTASNNGPVCAGSTLILNSSSTTSGVSYRWTGPNSFSSALQNPIIPVASTAATGTYTVSMSLNGCNASTTTSATVNLIPVVPVASNNSPLCNNGSLYLTANSSTPGVTYNWTGPSSYTSTQQNPSIIPATTTNAGTYTVYASLNGCNSGTTTTTASIVAGPTVVAYASPNDSICLGTTVTFTALPANPGSGASYLWLKNGIALPGSNALSFPVSGLIDGDVISFLLTPGTGAACTTPVNSNFITMTVRQYQQPIVEMQASDTTVWPGLLVNFNVTNTSGGANPKYQWKVNNQNIVGATSNVWGTTQLQDNDKVCVVMTPDFLCANPATASACVTMHVLTGINQLNNTPLKVYPNPAKETLTVEGLEGNTKVQLIDVLGRVVYTTVGAGTITIPTKQLSNGSYVLKLTTADGKNSVVNVSKE